MNNYKFLDKIGRGTHGTTYLMKSYEDSSYVVCKSVVTKYSKHAKKEVSILSKLNHKRIVRMINSVKVNSSIYIILEYANYGTLESMISYFSKMNSKPCMPLMWSVTAQVSDALYYLHSKGIIHRDIKPANILVNKFFLRENEYLEFKICDFSLSIETNYVKEPSILGTPYYMSPEVVSKTPYDFTVDIWGLGVILYELYNLKKPFYAANRELLFQQILKLEISECISEDSLLNWIVKSCLSKENRITSKEISKNERIRLNLTMLEVKYKEVRIEKLEEKIKELIKNNDCKDNFNNCKNNNQ